MKKKFEIINKLCYVFFLKVSNYEQIVALFVSYDNNKNDFVIAFWFFTYIK